MQLIKDPRGIHFAGDTAQCISKETTFRFQDVKALFYGQFFPIANEFDRPELAKPRLFSLNTNFRSHHAIIAFGSFVMKLLYDCRFLFIPPRFKELY